MSVATVPTLLRSSTTPIVNISRKRLFLAFLIASTGFDQLSVHFGDNSIRASYVLYFVMVVALLRHMQLPRAQTILICAFCALATAEMLYLGPSLHSTLYVCWVIFSYFIIFPLFFYFGREHREDFVAATLIAGRAQIIIGALLWASKIEYRAFVLYYEPSYFAYGLIPYVAMVVWRMYTGKMRSMVVDIFMLLLALISTGSAMLLCVIFVTWVSGMVMSGITLKQVLTLLLTLGLISACLIVYSQYSDGDMAKTIRLLIAGPDVVQNSDRTRRQPDS